MPGKRIKDLTALSGAGSANNDDVVIFDADADVTKRISRSQLAEGMQADVQVLTNKTIALGSNTVTGTTAQFNTALTDNNFATQAGAEVLTNKTIALANNTVNYTQGGVGASTRTVQSRLQDYVSVKDFGAVGNGVTDDTVSIQAAFNTGSSVLIPDGYTFLITSSLTIATTNPRTICGSGKIKQGANDINCIDVSGAQNLTIDGVGFEGYAATAAGTNFTKNQAVYADGGRNISVNNCIIYGFSFNGVQLRNVFVPKITENLFYNNYYDNPSGSDILLYSNTDSAGSIIRNNRCHSNNSQAIYVNAIGGDRDVLVEGNILYTLNAADWSEITDYSAAAGTQRNSATLLQRRHGVVFGYASAANLPGRFIIANNNIRSTQWSGIYRAASAFDPGPASVMGNVMSNVSMQNGASGSLEGGLLILCCSAGDIYDSNQIISVGNGNQNKAGIKFVPSDGFPGSVRFTKNTIKTSGMGIWLGGFLPENIIVAENDLYDFYQRGGVFYSPTDQNTTINANVIIRDNLIDGFNGSTFDRAAIFLNMAEGGVTVPQVIEVSGGSIRARADTSYFGVAFSGLAVDDTLAIGGGVAIDGVENAIWNNVFAVGRFPGLRLGRVMVRNSRNRVVCEAFNMGYNGSANGSAFAVVEAGGGVYQGVTKVVDHRGGAQALYQGKWLDNDRAEIVHTGDPTTGCWVQGDRVLYSAPAAASAPGAVCVTSGQFGLLSGITAATTATSTAVTFSAATGLAVGMFITIAGVAGTKRIVSLSGTAAVVNTACDATVAAGAVAYVTPVFKTMAAVAA